MMQKKWNIKVDLCEVRERLLNTGHGERLHCSWSGCERERLPAGLFVFCCCFFCKGGRYSAEGLNDTTLWSCCERERLPAGLFVETSDKKIFRLPRCLAKQQCFCCHSQTRNSFTFYQDHSWWQSQTSTTLSQFVCRPLRIIFVNFLNFLQVLAGSHKMGRLDTQLIGSGLTKRFV